MQNSLYMKVRTWNLKGVNNVIKRKKILNILKKNKIQIALLQETHLSDKEHQKLCRDWVGQIYSSSFSTKRCGVCILLHRNLPFTLITQDSDDEGRVILIKGLLFGKEIVIGCIYGPNNHNENFFIQVFSRLASLDCNNVILGGDFNLKFS